MRKIKKYDQTLSDQQLDELLNSLRNQMENIQHQIGGVVKEINKRRDVKSNEISKSIPKNYSDWSKENWSWVLYRSNHETEFEFKQRNNFLSKNFNKLSPYGFCPQTEQMTFAVHFNDSDSLKSQISIVVDQIYEVARRLSPHTVAGKYHKFENVIPFTIFLNEVYDLYITIDDVVEWKESYSRNIKSVSKGDIKENLSKALYDMSKEDRFKEWDKDDGNDY